MTTPWQPALYPVASRVHVPSLGAEHKLPPKNPVDNSVPNVFVVRNVLGVNSDYVKKISSDLAFHTGVVEDRCKHTLPYDPKTFSGIYDSGPAFKEIGPPPNTVSGGRFDNRSRMTHLPCISRKSSKKTQGPTVVEVAPTVESPSSIQKSTRLSSTRRSNTGTATSSENRRISDSSKTADKSCWDEHLLSLMSLNTARYLVSDLTPENAPRKRVLQNKVEKWYGEIPELLDILPDKIEEEDPPPPPLDHYLKRGKAKIKKAREWRLKTPMYRLLEEQINNPTEEEPTDPYDDKSKAPFYRLPVGVRKDKKNTSSEVADCNRTVNSIVVHRKPPTPPPTMKDFLNPHVGEKFFNTDNEFERDWLTGGLQIHHADSQKRIVMHNYNQYECSLQDMVPPKAKAKTSGAHVVHSKKQGARRWKSLPKVHNVSAEMQANAQAQENIASEEQRRQGLKDRKEAKNNSSLLKIVDEWRGKWHLNQKFADCSIDDLVRDMNDIHAAIRLQAILTCAKAASYVPPLTEASGIQLTPLEEESPADIPEPLALALEILLNDVNAQVRKASAICLFTLRRPCPLADGILREALTSGNSADRWAATQCFSHLGIADSDIIKELIEQLLNSEETLVHEQATYLLARVSKNTRLAHGMLAERLNSASWRHKVIVCKALPVLHGNINKDLAQKLSYLMWNDVNSEVRIAAAECLGKTGHGKDVHDDIKERLQGSERMRADALHKLGYLGIMTARLMPVFLKSFDDEYVSVRQEACIACSRLRVKDDRILERLVHLVTFDPIWKVKALAIQALGLIGVTTPRIRECLLWALRYETEAQVRLEACIAVLHSLRWLDEEVAGILLSRYLVESSARVHKEIGVGLQMMNISVADDMDTVAHIKAEVRRLNQKQRICEEIQENEAKDAYEEVHQRLISSPIRPKHQTQKDAEVESVRMMTPLELSDILESSGNGKELLQLEDTIQEESPSREREEAPSQMSVPGKLSTIEDAEEKESVEDAETKENEVGEVEYVEKEEVQEEVKEIEVVGKEEEEAPREDKTEEIEESKDSVPDENQESKESTAIEKEKEESAVSEAEEGENLEETREEKEMTAGESDNIDTKAVAETDADADAEDQNVDRSQLLQSQITSECDSDSSAQSPSETAASPSICHPDPETDAQSVSRPETAAQSISVSVSRPATGVASSRQQSSKARSELLPPTSAGSAMGSFFDDEELKDVVIHVQTPQPPPPPPPPPPAEVLAPVDLPASFYRLPKNSSHIKTTSIERAGTWNSLTSSENQRRGDAESRDPSVMPLRERTRTQLEVISRFEGIYLGEDEQELMLEQRMYQQMRQMTDPEMALQTADVVADESLEPDADVAVEAEADPELDQLDSAGSETSDTARDLVDSVLRKAAESLHLQLVDLELGGGDLE